METTNFTRENGTDLELHFELVDGKVVFCPFDIEEFELTANEVQDLPWYAAEVIHGLADDSAVYATDLGAGNGAFI